MARIRIRFAKVGKIRWTSHRDVARMWERAFRRAELPLVYTSGFSPRPKVSFGLALPTGHESVAEYLDLEFAGDGGLDLDVLPSRLSAALPLGVDALAAAEIDPRSPSLQEEVTSCSWRLLASAAPDNGPPVEADVVARAAEILAASSVVVTRVRKGEQVTDDIRPGILDLRVGDSSGLDAGGADSSPGVWLEVELTCQPRSLRPSELLAAFGTAVEERHVRRLNQWILRDGARWEPLTLAPLTDATSAPHAPGRAS